MFEDLSLQNRVRRIRRTNGDCPAQRGGVVEKGEKKWQERDFRVLLTREACGQYWRSEIARWKLSDPEGESFLSKEKAEKAKTPEKFVSLRWLRTVNGSRQEEVKRTENGRWVADERNRRKVSTSNFLSLGKLPISIWTFLLKFE